MVGSAIAVFCPPILSYYIAIAGVHPGRPRQAELPYIWQQRHRRQWVRMAHYPSQVCLTFGEDGRGQRSMRLRSDDQPGFYFSLWDSAQLPHGAALLRPEDESTPIPFLPWDIVKQQSLNRVAEALWQQERVVGIVFPFRLKNQEIANASVCRPCQRWAPSGVCILGHVARRRDRACHVCHRSAESPTSRSHLSVGLEARLRSSASARTSSVLGCCVANTRQWQVPWESDAHRCKRGLQFAM